MEPDETFFSPAAMGVNLLLCDAAQASGGKLFVLGGGLSVIGPNPQPLALAIHITVPWDQANQPRPWRIELIDEDGRPVTMGDKPVAVNGKFEAGRPAGLRAGAPLGVALAINLSALRLPAGVSYSFVLYIDDETRPEWRAPLFVRAPST